MTSIEHVHEMKHDPRCIDEVQHRQLSDPRIPEKLYKRGPCFCKEIRDYEMISRANHRSGCRRNPEARDWECICKLFDDEENENKERCRCDRLAVVGQKECLKCLEITLWKTANPTQKQREFAKRKRKYDEQQAEKRARLGEEQYEISQAIESMGEYLKSVSSSKKSKLI